jgi:uncharacterized cupredoxin-like copper-binding protein
MIMHKSLSFCLVLTATAASAQPAVVPVELSNFKFVPTAIQLRAGAPVTLHLQNASGGGHSFSAPEFFAAARVEARSAVVIRKGTIDVPAHAAVNITVVPGAGRFRLKCTHAFHATFGMKGTILVN